MRDKADVVVFRAGHESGLIARVKLIDVFRCETADACAVENIHKMRIILAIYILQLYAGILQILKSLAVKEIQRLIVLSQNHFLLTVRNRRKLLQVAYHQKLHPAERKVAAPYPAEFRVDVVEQVGPHH